MFRGHIGREIRARAVFMSEISGHDMLRVVIVILEQITTFEFFLWFTFVLDSILLTFCFIIILYYHAQEQNKTKIMPRINLNHICSHFGDC